jgi:hypothetical protein
MIFVKKIMEIRDTETPLDISQGWAHTSWHSSIT